MNGIQRVIKIFAICLAIFIIVNIFGWLIFGVSFLAYIDEDENHETSEVIPADGGQTYLYTAEQVSEISKIEIDIKYAEGVITKTSNPDITINARQLRNKIEVKLANGKLSIKEQDDWSWDKKIGEIRIFIPETINLSELDIDTGAGKLTMDGINAKKLDLDHGAGSLEISDSRFEKAEIDAGAGKAQIMSSVLNNLDLDTGVRKSRNRC